MASFDRTLAADEDLRAIWLYSYETWGRDQANIYFDKIEACCEAIGHRRAKSKTLTGLPSKLRIHRCEHHYIFWLAYGRPLVVAILHERMDVIARLKHRL